MILMVDLPRGVIIVVVLFLGEKEGGVGSSSFVLAVWSSLFAKFLRRM
jgi:hypothetical protein